MNPIKFNMADLENKVNNVAQCPFRIDGGNEADDWAGIKVYDCSLTEGPDADMKGYGCDECEYKGNYVSCPRYLKAREALSREMGSC